MRNILDTYLIFSQSSCIENTMLLYVLSRFQHTGINLVLILDEDFNNTFGTSLLESLIYLIQKNDVFNATIYTKDKKLLSIYKQLNDKYTIKNRLQVHSFNVMDTRYIDDTKHLINLDKFKEIIVIEDNKTFYTYNSKLYIPVLEVK